MRNDRLDRERDFDCDARHACLSSLVGQIVRRTVRQKNKRDESLRRYLIAEGFDPHQAEIIVEREKRVERETPSMREYPVLSLDEDADET
jgi:hypothetical protein